MRVLFVYKYLSLGGVETMLRARLDVLHQCGVEASAWFLWETHGRSVFEGVEHLISVGDLDALTARLRAHPVDVVSSIDTPECLAVVDALEQKPTVIVEVHTPYAEALRYVRALRSDEVERIFVPSRAQALVVDGLLTSTIPIDVVPNALAAGFLTEPRPFVPAPTTPIVAWIGRLDALKNWRELIQIAALLNRRRSVQFWIIGRAAEASEELALFHELEAARVLESVRWFRGVPHQALPRFLDAIRASGGVLVSTSRGESFGLTIAEAMARECAVMAPDAGPFVDLVESGVTGRRYRLGDVADAVSQLDALLDDPTARERYGRAARTAILSAHSPLPCARALVAALTRGMTVKSTSGRTASR